MPGPAKKPDRQRQDRTKAPDLRLVDTNLEIPTPPAKLDKATREFWNAYWSSELAAATHADTDLPSFRRLAQNYTLINKLRRATEREPLVEGSMGQPVAHPGFAVLARVEAETRQLEDRFGCNPKARLNLGLKLGQVVRQLDELSWETDDDNDEPDPRIIDL